MPYFVAFFTLSGVAFSNSSMTSFSLNFGAKRFSPTVTVSCGKIFKLLFKFKLTRILTIFGYYGIMAPIILLFIHCTNSDFLLADLYHVTLGYDAITSLTSLSWCNSRGVNSIHDCLYTMALTESKFDDSFLQHIQFEK